MTGRPVVHLVGSAAFVTRWADAVGPWSAPVSLITSRVAPPADPRLLERVLRARTHDLLFLTSAHALQFVPDAACAGWSAACVGARSAEVARSRGVEVLFEGHRGAEALAAGLLHVAPGIETYLHPASAHARPEGPARLREGGKQVDVIEAYTMEEAPDLAEAVAAAPPPDVLVFGSPRSVMAWLGVDPVVSTDVPRVVLGEITRAALREAEGDRDPVCLRPDPDALRTWWEEAAPGGAP